MKNHKPQRLEPLAGGVFAAFHIPSILALSAHDRLVSMGCARPINYAASPTRARSAIASQAEGRTHRRRSFFAAEWRSDGGNET
jgi:hypothetical protein